MQGSAPRTQTVTERTNNEPWSGAQPALQTALSGALSQYNSGMPAYYPGSTVAPMSNETQAGLTSIRDNAGLSTTLAGQQWNAISGAMHQNPIAGTWNLQNTARGFNSNPYGGFFAGQTDIANPFLSSVGAAGAQTTNTSSLNPFITGAAANPMAGQFRSAAGAPVTGAGMDTLTRAATGGMMQNPWLDATFDQGARAIRDQLDTAFNRSGRSLNNTSYADAFSRNLGDFASNLYGQAYDSDMTRRMNSAGQLAGYEQGGVDRMLAALGSEAQLGEAGLGRQYDASSQLAGYSSSDLSRLLQSSGMGADIFGQNRGQNLQAGTTGAGLYDNDFSNALNSYLALAGQQNSNTGFALQGAGMLPGVYDTNQQGATDLIGVGSSLEAYNQALIDADRERYDYGANSGRSNVEWLNAIASGMGALGGTATTNSQRPYQASNPFLQGLGALSSVASLASVFGFSDRRLKDDAELVGVDDGGNRIWRFRYPWSDDVQYGVMADEVDPRFVVTHPSGFQMVDYGSVFA